MSATVIRVTPEIPGPTAPTLSGKPEAEKPQTPPPQSNAPEVKTDERPKWLPEKFKSAEEMATAYSELEKKLSAPKPEGEKKTEESKPDGEQKPDQAKQGEAFKPFFDEFETNGKLSDESYAALEKQGFSRKMVDAYARGVQAERDESVGKVYDAVGGKENYAKVTEWAAKNLSASEINAFNSMLETGTPEQVALAAAGLNTRYVAANGSPSRLVHGQSQGSAVQTFRSTAEVTAAMSDPRYSTDQAYRDEVAARLANSTVL